MSTTVLASRGHILGSGKQAALVSTYLVGLVSNEWWKAVSVNFQKNLVGQGDTCTLCNKLMLAEVAPESATN